MSAETITISLSRYLRLLDDSEFLGWLEARGVDNWDGYEEAQKMMAENNDE